MFKPKESIKKITPTIPSIEEIDSENAQGLIGRSSAEKSVLLGATSKENIKPQRSRLALDVNDLFQIV